MKKSKWASEVITDVTDFCEAFIIQYMSHVSVL